MKSWWKHLDSRPRPRLCSKKQPLKFIDTLSLDTHSGFNQHIDCSRKEQLDLIVELKVSTVHLIELSLYNLVVPIFPKANMV